MTDATSHGDNLGINGLGRIGKLTVWHHVARGHFGGLVVNVGRDVGRSLDAVCSVIERDSTYGSMHRFLFGVSAQPSVHILDEEQGVLDVAGTPVTVLQEARNPRDIEWKRHGVRVVVDTTGAFNDPTRPGDEPGGALRGHLAAGAETVINSAAFKIKDRGLSTPDDVVTLIAGINHDAFSPTRHNLISAASCTTTAVAHMLKPILDVLGASSLMTASMSTVHAATNTQQVLDTLPAAGSDDLRKTRSVLNSIILTSTNAAAALELVLPEIAQVGFMADSVRVPIPTVSLAILNMTFQSVIGADDKSSVTREIINSIYADAAAGAQRDQLVFSEDQNVPGDLAGARAAVVIEGTETHTRTGFASVDLASLPGIDDTILKALPETTIDIPVTHAKVFGWYDNEFGSYTNLLGDLTVHVHESLDS
ncbi:MAG: glyceraldehyde 3-phosphate dehydrogenase NAD-binding domain-containing protein [Acidimicrobiia bacterium]|nr:MAG: glyceraldehyde 3-phosphate dehydrogenase NAD-binding domain-containing protein [Acidimicrobiia bacterium]